MTQFVKPPGTRLSIGYIGDRDFAFKLTPDCQNLVDILNPPQASFRMQELDFCLLTVNENCDPKQLQKGMQLFADMDKEHQVPRILWDLRQGGRAQERAVYADIAARCDAVFASCEAVQDTYQRQKPATRIGFLPPAIQPAQHNPYGKLGQKTDLPAVVQSKIDPNSAQTNLEILQAAASGMLPFHLTDRADKSAGSPLLFSGDDSAYAQLVANPLLRRQLAQKAWRFVFSHHTMAQRLAQIAETLNIKSGWEPFPHVTVFVPSFRPGLVEICIKNFEKQSYPNRDLVIVLHGNDDISQLAKKVAQHHNGVTIAKLGTGYGVGACMNLAIELARGSTAIKMDDDDDYGPHYLMDMMLPHRAVGADIFGKPPFFFYSEGLDKTFVRTVGLGLENTLGSAWDLVSSRLRMSGATHSGRTEFLREVRFDERAMGAADTAFFERCASFKARVGIWDGFNTATFRAANAAHHTWQQADRQLLQGADFVGSGRAKTCVFA